MDDPRQQIVPLSFPLAGVDSSTPADSQVPMTTRQAQNVRSIEPLTLRLRGGSRPGITQFIRSPLPVPTVFTA